MKPTYCQANSLGYEQAADLMRLSAERLAEGRASFPAYRVAAAVWALTVPFAKGWDMVFVQEIGARANIKDRRNVGRAIKECVALGALEWEPSRYVPPKGQPGKPSLVGLPGAPKMGSHRPPLTDAKTGSHRPQYLSVEVMSNEASLDGDTHRSSLIGASEDQDVDGLGSVPDPAEAGTPEEMRPARCATPGCNGAPLSGWELCMECDRARFYGAS